MKKFAILAFILMLIPFYTIASEKNSYELLIISHKKFLREIEKFAEFKEGQGIKTKVVSLDDIYNGKYFECNGRDDAERIKYFIKNAYDTWHIKYLLLVGSAKYVPVRYVYLNDRSSTWEYERKFISDLYYADIYDANRSFSSWDTNGNGYYGEFEHEINGREYTDNINPIPEIGVARIPCRNKMELKNALTKIMNYRADGKMLLIGGDSYPNDPSGNIAEGIYLENKIEEEMGWDTIKLHPPRNWREISRHINGGVSIAVFEGAGAHHLWATHPYNDEKWIYYYGWNIRLLKNNIYPIVLTSGARLAKFDEERECFNWIWIASSHGGVASIGSTGLCWMGHGKNVTEFYLGNLHLRFFRAYKNSSLLGDAWRNAITSYLQGFKWKGKVEKAFHLKAAEEFEVFGDPTMALYHPHGARIANILYVGGSGNGNYSSIQYAMENASDGDTIIVFPGEYHENVTVDKRVIIIARNATLFGSFTVLASSTIEGFKITSPLYSIKCLSGRCTFRNNIFNAYYGITGKNSTCMRVEKNMFGCKYGVYLTNSHYSKFYDNVFCDNWYGIWCENCSFSELYNNNFSLNRWYALWLDSCNGSVIQNNSFHENWYSIFLYHSNDCFITENDVLHNEHGPQIVFSSFNYLARNNIARNEHYGIYIDNASMKNEIVENNIIENAFNARDDGRNKWDGNYWSDYIGNKFPLLAFIGVPKYIPKWNFDWHPSIQPHS